MQSESVVANIRAVRDRPFTLTLYLAQVVTAGIAIGMVLKSTLSPTVYTRDLQIVGTPGPWKKRPDLRRDGRYPTRRLEGLVQQGFRRH
jgi:hypothetical protein